MNLTSAAKTLQNSRIKQTFIPVSLVLTLSLLWPLLAKSHDEHSTSHGVKIEELANSSKMWDGSKLPNYPDGQPKIKVLRIQVASGVTLPWHYHPVINAAVILQGTLELQLKDGSHKIYRKGDALIEVVNTIHTGKALGPIDVDLIVFYAGEEAIPTTVLAEHEINR
jgi:quercetin dioxygenase-like cupin family protein